MYSSQQNIHVLHEIQIQMNNNLLNIKCYDGNQKVVL